MARVVLPVSPRPLSLAAVLAASLGCTSPGPGAIPASVTLPPALPTPSTSTSTAVTAERSPALCAGRAGCTVHRVRRAGVDAAGRKLAVVTLDLGVAAHGAGQPEPPPSDTLEETDRQDTTSPLRGDAFGACRRLEYWLTAGGDPPQLLAVACNDGYGASVLGVDVLTVGDNAFTRSQHGGSAWRWSWTNEVTLSPLRVTSSSWDGAWSVSVNTREASWDWAHFEGRESWYAPPCDAKGEPPVDPRPPQAPYASVLVPRLALESGFRAQGFRETALGACAADIDGTGARGFLTFGEKGPREAASVRAVLSDHDELFVEVRDAHPSGPSARWVADDHLEIWLAAERGDYTLPCVAKRAWPRQWGVRVADGQVFAGYGQPSPKELTVERAAAGPGVVRFKIALPPKQTGITIAYSDGDGKKQQRVFATSVARKGAPESLSAPFDVPPARAVCKVTDGRLEPVTTWKPAPDHPFADEQP
jgi:hypothetical protein